MQKQIQDEWFEVLDLRPTYRNIPSDFDGPSDRELVQLPSGTYEVRHIAYTGERHLLGVAANWWAAVRMAG